MRHAIADILTMKGQEKVKYGKFLLFFKWIVILLDFFELFFFYLFKLFKFVGCFSPLTSVDIPLRFSGLM